MTDGNRDLRRIGMNEVHIWTVCPDPIDDADLLAAYDRLLTDDERTRRAGFRFARGQHDYLVTRALVRSTLADYLDTDPVALRFVANEYGRPELDSTSGEASSVAGHRLHFNLSHTHNLIVCAVALGREVGVDVETIDRRAATVAIADRFFSTTEVAALHALPVEQQRQRFFAYWTLKESYIKARGMGLALPLDQFSFHLDEAPPIRISFGGGIDDDPAMWQFTHSRHTERHDLALSVRRIRSDGDGDGGTRDQANLTIAVRDIVPLAGQLG